MQESESDIGRQKQGREERTVLKERKKLMGKEKENEKDRKRQ
jgi:hypothetical protein